jgi:hypothetical protein
MRQGVMKARTYLIGIAIALILFGTVGTILAIIPQIETLLLALAGHGYVYLAFGIAGGLLLYYARRNPPRTGPRLPRKEWEANDEGVPGAPSSGPQQK